MRILHIATRHLHGGAERNVEHSLIWEVAHGHDVHFAAGRDSMLSDLPPGVTAHPIPELVRSIHPVHDLLAFRHLRKLVRQTRFDVVHTHQSKAGVLGRLAARGSQSIIVHTIHMASFGPAYDPIASALFVQAEQRCAAFTDQIISVGGELRELYLRAGVGTARQYLVIHSPIDLDAFVAVRKATSDQRTATRLDLGLDPALPTALVVASLEPRKRVDLVIGALADALRSRHMALMVAGDGPDRQRLALQSRHLRLGEATLFLGHVSDLPRIMTAADVLVHAATIEGVPQAVIQAVAAGLPVVATEMIGLREVDGAPIQILPRDGTGLAGAAVHAATSPGKLLPVDSLHSWTTASVDQELERLHEALGSAVGDRIRDH